MQKDMYIAIPERPGAPQVTLYVKWVSNDTCDPSKKPSMFILPGGPGANHTNYEAYECLANKANLLFFDPRGCGLSGQGDPATYTMTNYLDDVEFIRDYLGLNQVMILGKSYGAMCALGYALRYPNHLSRLILAAGAQSCRFIETSRQNMQRLGNEEQKRLYAMLIKGELKSMNDLKQYFDATRTLYSWRKRQDPAMVLPVASLPFSLDSLNQGFKTFLHTFNFEDKLADVKCKTLIIVGEEDWITDKIHSKEMSQHIPDNQLVIVPEAGHAIEIDTPEFYFETIRKFI